MGFLRRLPAVLGHNLRVLLHGSTASDRPLLKHLEPEGPHVRSLMSHRHVWGSCRWNGQYWYARCVAVESCTARIAC